MLFVSLCPFQFTGRGAVSFGGVVNWAFAIAALVEFPLIHVPGWWLNSHGEDGSERKGSERELQIRNIAFDEGKVSKKWPSENFCEMFLKRR